MTFDACVALAEQGVHAVGIASGYVPTWTTQLGRMRRRIPLGQRSFRRGRRSTARNIPSGMPARHAPYPTAKTSAVKRHNIYVLDHLGRNLVAASGSDHRDRKYYLVILK
jgi:hypothetical protein